jgi:hypothetical protein
MNFATSHRRLPIARKAAAAINRTAASEDAARIPTRERWQLFGSCLMIASLLVMAMFG